MTRNLGPWSPVNPALLPDLLQGMNGPWWLAGGWSLDSYLGRQTREHADTDVLILRRDHLCARQVFADWDAHAVDPPGSLRPWELDDPLPDRVHDAWLRRRPDECWSVQLMIDDTIGDTWVYRRNPSITRHIAELAGPASTPAMRVLAPEIQLLYKSKDVRPKDQADFDAVLPALTAERRTWLREALAIDTPVHAWLSSL